MSLLKKVTKMFKKENKAPTSDEVEIPSQLVKTGNVAYALQQLAKKYNIPTTKIDFDIVNIETQIKMTKDSDFEPATAEIIELISNNIDMLLDENLEIKQQYDIKIKPFQTDEKFHVVGKIEARDLTHAIYHISPKSHIFYDDMLEGFNIELEKKFINELNKRKLKAGILIDLPFWEEEFKADIKKLVSVIEAFGGLEEPFTLTLCKTKPEPIPTVQLKIIEHYKQYAQHSERVKALVYPVHKDDLLLEIIKPKLGRNGRTYKGKLIKAEPLKTTEVPHYRINEDVRKEEDDDVIKYYANKNGYVQIKENVILIKKELEINQISLRSGHVKGGEDSDVSMKIKETNAMKEAIKDGMVVETTELIVGGNVGKGAKIKAKYLEIGGQTHKKSKIIANEAKINVHKGQLKAKKAHITRLEGGIIKADEVHLEQVISGKVVAKEIFIELLGSHITLIAADLIEVTKLKGSENKFIIDEAAVLDKEELIHKLEAKIRQIEIKIRQFQDKLKRNKNQIKKNKPQVDAAKEKIEQEKQRGLQVNPNLLEKIKKFKQFVKKTKKIEEDIQELFNLKQKAEDEIKELQKNAFDAKIISKSGFTEFNRIEFHLQNPKEDIIYDTKASDKNINLFTLEELESGVHKIVSKAIEEYQIKEEESETQEENNEETKNADSSKEQVENNDTDEKGDTETTNENEAEEFVEL
ncbi:MAG: DUF342 domain-containing protein [Epsilonproteobacteria bacterium]|nr:DUF342 domain-containing protein [Campylobacterota bacterium]